jgi:hypothetical protein
VQTIFIWITKASFVVKLIFLRRDCMMNDNYIAISGQFEHSSQVWPQLDFLKVGFNRIIGIDDVIIRVGG